MKTHKIAIAATGFMLLMMIAGCDENENARLAGMAEKNLDRQAEQNRQLAAMQREVAEGSRRLVEAGAAARNEMATLQRDAQAERTEIGRQRDMLEEERRELAGSRYLDPVVAAAIHATGLLLACLLPLVLCGYLLQRPVVPADDTAIAELLLHDLIVDQPLVPRFTGASEGAPLLDEFCDDSLPT